MDGKDAIITKIYEDAAAEAAVLVSSAEESAANAVSEVRAEIERAKEEAVSLAKKEGEELIKRGQTVAELEVRKLKLAAKKQIIDDAFARAADKIGSQPESKYKKLITGMLLAHAEDGDEVIIAEKDAGVITEDLIASAAKKKKINLKLSKTKGKFQGGIILKGEGVDKNLTLEVELKLLKERLETEVALIIFGKE